MSVIGAPTRHQSTRFTHFPAMMITPPFVYLSCLASPSTYTTQCWVAGKQSRWGVSIAELRYWIIVWLEATATGASIITQWFAWHCCILCGKAGNFTNLRIAWSDEVHQAYNEMIIKHSWRYFQDLLWCHDVQRLGRYGDTIKLISQQCSFSHFSDTY